MSLGHGSSIVTDGLVFYYDMNNTQKSWKGAPATNMYADGDFSSLALHPVRSGTWAIVDDPRNSFKKVLKATPSGSNQYHGRDITAVVSTAYSLQMEVYVSSDFDGTNVRMHPEQGGLGAAVVYNLTNKGTWQILKFDGKAATTTNIRLLAYIFSSFTTGYVLVSNVQVEQNTFASPFTATARSTAQSLVDIVGNNSITCNSLTYAADNTFSFNGSNSITFTNPLVSQPNLSQEWSVIAWVNISTAANQLLLTGINNALYLTTGANSTLLYLNGGVNDYYMYGGAIGGVGWCQVAYRFKNSTGARTIYKNGVNISTSGPNASSTPIGNSGTFTLGTSINGSVSTIMIYNRYISDNELIRNFNATRGRYSI